MIGWHYTDKRNLPNILKNGLKPYRIEKDDLLNYFDVYPMGVWLWEYPQSEQEELGTVLFQLSTKGNFEIVKLEVEVEKHQLLYYNDNGTNRLVRTFHTGDIGVFSYHDGSQSALISVQPIKPENIKHVATFNILDIIKHSKKETNEHSQAKPAPGTV